MVCSGFPGKDWTPNIFQSNTMNTENPLLNQLSLIDISNIEGVRFFQNGWQTFSVSLVSIKRIAVYIEKKYGKTTFLPWELFIEKTRDCHEIIV